jgi:hypothetical protein
MNISEWISKHSELTNAAKSACAALAEHYGCLPDPRNESETENLLAWRRQQFYLSHRPVDDDALQRAAPAAAQFLEEMKYPIIEGVKRLLNGIETSMRFDARKNANGLFSPEMLKDIVQRAGEHAYIDIRRLPEGHPLRRLGHDPSLPLVCISRVSIHWLLSGGEPRYLLEPWALVSDIENETKAARADKARRDALEREASQEQLQRQQEREEMFLPAEERRIRALERRLAELQSARTA